MVGKTLIISHPMNGGKATEEYGGDRTGKYPPRKTVNQGKMSGTDGPTRKEVRGIQNLPKKEKNSMVGGKVEHTNTNNDHCNCD